jgi:hypothetical protein
MAAVIMPKLDQIVRSRYVVSLKKSADVGIPPLVNPKSKPLIKARHPAYTLKIAAINNFEVSSSSRESPSIICCRSVRKANSLQTNSIIKSDKIGENQLET